MCHSGASNVCTSNADSSTIRQTATSISKTSSRSRNFISVDDESASQRSPVSLKSDSPRHAPESDMNMSQETVGSGSGESLSLRFLPDFRKSVLDDAPPATRIIEEELPSTLDEGHNSNGGFDPFAVPMPPRLTGAVTLPGEILKRIAVSIHEAKTNRRCRRSSVVAMRPKEKNSSDSGDCKAPGRPTSNGEPSVRQESSIGNSSPVVVPPESTTPVVVPPSAVPEVQPLERSTTAEVEAPPQKVCPEEGGTPPCTDRTDTISTVDRTPSPVSARDTKLMKRPPSTLISKQPAPPVEGTVSHLSTNEGNGQTTPSSAQSLLLGGPTNGGCVPTSSLELQGRRDGSGCRQVERVVQPIGSLGSSNIILPEAFLSHRNEIWGNHPAPPVVPRGAGAPLRRQYPTSDGFTFQSEVGVIHPSHSSIKYTMSSGFSTTASVRLASGGGGRSAGGSSCTRTSTCSPYRMASHNSVYLHSSVGGARPATCEYPARLTSSNLVHPSGEGGTHSPTTYSPMLHAVELTYSTGGHGRVLTSAHQQPPSRSHVPYSSSNPTYSYYSQHVPRQQLVMYSKKNNNGSYIQTSSSALPNSGSPLTFRTRILQTRQLSTKPTTGDMRTTGGCSTPKFHSTLQKERALLSSNWNNYHHHHQQILRTDPSSMMHSQV